MGQFRFPVKDEDFMKSSQSTAQPLLWCVAVAVTPRGVAVRDTKDSRKKTLFFTRNEWKAFIKGVKKSEFEV